MHPSRTFPANSHPRSPNRPRNRHPKGRRPRSPIVLFLLLLLWSVILGIGLAHAQTTPTSETIAQVTNPAPEGLVDVVPDDLTLGQSLYLENCSTCHVGLPPAVMPTETWRRILTDPNHYGAEITPIPEPGIYIAWNYVSLYSRPLNENESIPFRLRSSRYFKALHPNVDFSDRVTVRSCIACHPGAEQFDYRSLTPEWEDAP